MTEATKKRPGRPPKNTKNTEHILISPELKKGLEGLRTIYKKDSFGEVILQLYQRHLFILTCTEFIKQLAIINKRDNESEADSFDRMIRFKPKKIELSNVSIWSDSQDIDIND
jgi:predicted CopG family antitoxin